MITVHGRNTSSNVQPVIWLLNELELPHERLDVGGAFGGTDTPEYRAMNPMGLIPSLQDGDVTMFESQAIMRYLAAQHGERFWPASPAARAPSDQWMEWTKTSVAPLVVYKIFWQLIRTPAAQRDHAALDEAVSSTARVMTIAESQLAKHDWLAGPDTPYVWADHRDEPTPFCALAKPLSEAKVAIITTAAPFDPTKGDQGPGALYNGSAKFFTPYRADASNADTRISHIAYDRKHTAAKDQQSWLPIRDRREHWTSSAIFLRSADQSQPTHNAR